MLDRIETIANTRYGYLIKMLMYHFPQFMLARYLTTVMSTENLKKCILYEKKYLNYNSRLHLRKCSITTGFLFLSSIRPGQFSAPVWIYFLSKPSKHTKNELFQFTLFWSNVFSLLFIVIYMVNKLIQNLASQNQILIVIIWG